MRRSIEARAARAFRHPPSSGRERPVTAWASPSFAAWGRCVAVPLAVGLVCLRSLFHGGYLLQLDVVFGPRPAPLTVGFGTPVTLLQTAGVEIVGGALTGRLYALGTLFFAGFAPMVLLRREPWFAQMAGGFLGMLNPWVYDRLVDGQWDVVNGAAALFLWIAAWEELQARPGLGRAVLLGFCTAAVAAFDAHSLGPLLVLAVVGFVWLRLWRRRAAVLWTFASFAVAALLLSYAAVGFFLNHRGGYSAVQQFTRADFAFFRSVSDRNYGLIPNLVGLYGYWGERIGRFPVASQDATWWPVTTAVIVGAAVAGAWLCRARAWLLLCGVIGLAVSASTALPNGVDTASWLARRVPLVGVYREPQKWSALWLVALVTLSAGAIGALAKRKLHRRASMAAALAYVVVMCTLFPAGLAQIRQVPGIVKPLHYPPYWSRTAEFIDRAVPADERILVLPWHLYQSLNVSEGRVVANPAPVFFPGRLVVPHNLEIPGRFSEVTSPTDRIGTVIERRGYSSCAVARAIRRAGLRWVVVLDGAEARGIVLGLRRCAFALVQGRPGSTAVVKMSRPAVYNSNRGRGS
jgi:hypothetical protein